MLHDYAVYRFLFHSLFRLLEFALSIGTGSALPPNFHRGSLIVRTSSLNADFVEDGTVSVGSQYDVVVGHAEIKYTKASVISLVGRRLYNSMHGSFVEAA